jgi:hypothetical protein
MTQRTPRGDPGSDLVWRSTFVGAVIVISALFILQFALFDSLGKTASLLFGAFSDRVQVRDPGKFPLHPRSNLTSPKGSSEVAQPPSTIEMHLL